MKFINISTVLSSLSRRESIILLLGGICLTVVLPYFFVIEPFNKQTQSLQQTTEVRLNQLQEMQDMAKQLKATQPSADAKKLLDGLISGETLENGQRVLITRAISLAKAKSLLPRLAPLGKVTLKQQQNSVQIWFTGTTTK